MKHKLLLLQSHQTHGHHRQKPPPGNPSHTAMASICQIDRLDHLATILFIPTCQIDRLGHPATILFIFTCQIDRLDHLATIYLYPPVKLTDWTILPLFVYNPSVKLTDWTTYHYFILLIATCQVDRVDNSPVI